MIRTVLGDIEPKDLGITMCHEHLSMDLFRVRGDLDSTFRDPGQILPELQKITEYGVKAVVEQSTIDMGRDVLALREYSAVTGLHIVASTGFYLQDYHPAFLANARATAIAALFERELTQGIDDTGIRAGLIGEVATGRGDMSPEEKKVLIAAAIASVNTGASVSTHCDMGTLGLEQARLLKDYFMRPDKIILGHLDLVDEIDYHLRILAEGVNIAFDTIGKTAYLSDGRRANLLIKLIERGHVDQLVLSQDVSHLSYMTQQGGMGYTAVMSSFIPRLKEQGVCEEHIHKMLVSNSARILNLE